MSTKVLKCVCESSFQDKTYGKGMRLMNQTSKGNKDKITYRCTICKKEV